jgi:hypothetical protein
MTTKFETLKLATDAIMLLDFDKVIAYKIEYKNEEKIPGWWKVSRKILTNFPMGKATWVVL